MLKFIVAQFHDHWLIVRYLISGSIAALSQLGMLVYLVEHVQVWHMWAVAYAFLFSALIAFAMHKFWTFGDYTGKAHFQILPYLLLVAIAFAMNISLMYLFVDIFHVWYVMAQVVTMGMVATVTFLTNKNIIFNQERALFFHVLKKNKDTDL